MPLLSEETPEWICELIGCGWSGPVPNYYVLAFVLFKQLGLAFIPAGGDSPRLILLVVACWRRRQRLTGPRQASFWTSTISVQLLLRSVSHRSFLTSQSPGSSFVLVVVELCWAGPQACSHGIKQKEDSTLDPTLPVPLPLTQNHKCYQSVGFKS